VSGDERGTWKANGKSGNSKGETTGVEATWAIGKLARSPVERADRNSGSAEASGVGLSIGRMEKTTSRKRARARLLERQHEAAAAREARERANIGDLTEFTVRSAQIDEVDDWLAARIDKLKAEAQCRRQRHRVAAGKALQAMRLRGETVTAIAAQTNLSISRVREFLRVAADAGDDTASEANTPDAQVLPMPSHNEVGPIGHAPNAAVAGAR
jgi:hypothetical protein